MKLRFLAAAYIEQTEAATYYELQRTGLGSDFVDELERTLGRVMEHPNAWSPGSRRTRSCQMKRFSYSVIYRVYEDEILVVALQHHSREPHTWEHRITE